IIKEMLRCICLPLCHANFISEVRLIVGLPRAISQEPQEGTVVELVMGFQDLQLMLPVVMLLHVGGKASVLLILCGTGSAPHMAEQHMPLCAGTRPAKPRN